MQRNIIIVLTLITFILLSAPIVVGRKIKKEYLSMVNTINLKKGVVDNLRLELISYNMGYLSSTSVVKISIKVDDKTLDFNYSDYILHGPLVKYGGRRNYQLGKIIGRLESNSLLDKLFRDLEPLRVVTDLTFDQKWNFEVLSPKTHYAMKKDTIAIWGGLTINGTLNSKFDNFNMEFNMPQIGIKNQSSIFYIKDFSIIADTFLNNLDLIVGKLNFNLDNVSYRTKKVNYIVDDLNYDLDINNVVDNINFWLTLTCSKVVVPMGSYGPIKYTFKLENISEFAFKNFIESTNFLSIKKDFFEENKKSLIKKFLPNKPEVKIENTEFYIGENKIIVSLSATAGGTKIFNYDDMDEVLSSLNVRVFSRIPKVLIENYFEKKIKKQLENEKFVYDLSYEGEQMPVPSHLQDLDKELKKRLTIKLFEFKRKNIIKDRGDSYQIEALYKNSSLRINGQEMELHQLFEYVTS